MKKVNTKNHIPTKSFYEYDFNIKKHLLFTIFINCNESAINDFFIEFIKYLNDLQIQILKAKQKQFIKFIKENKEGFAAYESASDVLSAGKKIKIT